MREPAVLPGTTAMTPEAPVLRDAREDELAELEALQWRASLIWDEYRADLEANPDAIAIPLEQIQAGRIRVATDEDDRPIGFSAVCQHDSDAVELDGLFVEPSRMRRGIGARLVADVAGRAARAGVARVEVVANPAAVAFYARQGFRQTDVSQTRFGPAPRMVLDLSDRGA
ncbi:MAG: GNAT family N-acetyltransferase [Solirubrobacterales bacterium]|nr:GNAT family N-acetyltransferase [Solirubrobacterales bacterium]